MRVQNEPTAESSNDAHRVHRSKARATVAGAAFAALAALSAPVAAQACALDVVASAYGDAPTVQSDQDTAAPHAGARLSALPDGLYAATLDCGGEMTPLEIWTLTVDADEPHLGVRDDALFSEEHTGPLVRVGDAVIGKAARVTVLLREQTARRTDAASDFQQAPYRTFGTVCDVHHFGTPLHCGVGARRIKIRSDARDSDLDGALDLSFHQVSVYDGADRLQVISFPAAYDPSPMAAAADWVALLDKLALLAYGD